MQRHTIEAVVDRLVVRDGIRVRLTDSVETALKWGESRIVVLRERRRDGASEKRSDENPCSAEQWEELRYSTNYGSAIRPFP